MFAGGIIMADIKGGRSAASLGNMRRPKDDWSDVEIHFLSVVSNGLAGAFCAASTYGG